MPNLGSFDATADKRSISIMILLVERSFIQLFFKRIEKCFSLKWTNGPDLILFTNVQSVALGRKWTGRSTNSKKSSLKSFQDPVLALGKMISKFIVYLELYICGRFITLSNHYWITIDKMWVACSASDIMHRPTTHWVTLEYLRLQPLSSR